MHYLNVDSLGSTDVCLLINNGEFRSGSLMDPGKDVEEVYFFAREFRLNEGGLPKEVEQRCDKLRESESTHDNVATFLGLIVEEHVQPLIYSVARIFEEFMEGEWNDKRINYCTCVCVCVFVCTFEYTVNLFEWHSLVLILHVLFPLFMSPW